MALHINCGTDAIMKSLSPALQAHLDDGTTTLSWCWRISRSDGVALGFTDHDRPLAFDGTDFEPESGFAASEIRAESDLAVVAQDATGVLTSDRITETDILDGRWDNAAVELWRVNWADASQRVLLRRGAVGQIRRGRMAFVAEVRSLAHVLGQTVGRTFQAGCDAELGDARCGIDLENAVYKGTGVVTDLLRERAFMASGLAGFEAGWFAFGTLTWTSGANAGRITEVLSQWPDRYHRHPDPFWKRRCAPLLKATVSSRAQAATSASPPAAGSSPTRPTSGVFPTYRGRMPCCAMPARTAAMMEPFCDNRRSRPCHCRRAPLARYALPRSGQPARGRLRLPRPRPWRLARGGGQ
jgi:uncharacterized phage protein (TIGR02218 family)